MRKTIGGGPFGKVGVGVGRKRVYSIKRKRARRMKLMGDAIIEEALYIINQGH